MMEIIIGSVVCLIAAIIAARFGKTFATNMLANATASVESADVVLRNAQKQREMILEEARSAAREQYAAEASQLEEEHEIIARVLSSTEEELNSRQSEVDKRFHELSVKEQTLQGRLDAASKKQESTSEVFEKKRSVDLTFASQLEQRLNLKHEEVEHDIREEILNSEKLGISKWMMENSDQLKLQSSRFARDVMTTVLARYSPRFIWPKTSFSVEVSNKDLMQRHFGDGSPIVALLLDNTMTTLEAVESPESPGLIKISGGAGIDKEAIRLTLEEMFASNVFNPDRIRNIIEKHRKSIDKITLKMGQDALRILELDSMHPEILKMIGSLNYRTSHRQNQYFHSLEVARLAGMLANEVGVDHKLAKRAGLLHDIGKSLDYRIEGSHAVISGDYATRFGEAPDVVDTVLSHHDDKIVETPFAYILKAADAMSGARPGARVDMEEGYQKRIDGIVDVVKSFEKRGIVNLAIMSAGREIHIFVDNHKIKERDTEPLAMDIARKLESDVQFPGQIKVTIIRRTEVSEVA